MKIIELLNLEKEDKAPKKIYFDGNTYDHISIYWKEYNDERPIQFLYRNENDSEDFLLRDYGLSLQNEVEEVINKRPRRKVLCVETNKIFNSPVEAGRYYGFEDGDMVSKVCRGVREKTKGLTFKYLDEED